MALEAWEGQSGSRAGQQLTHQVPQIITDLHLIREWQTLLSVGEHWVTVNSLTQTFYHRELTCWNLYVHVCSQYVHILMLLKHISLYHLNINVQAILWPMKYWMYSSTSDYMGCPWPDSSLSSRTSPRWNPQWRELRHRWVRKRWYRETTNHSRRHSLQCGPDWSAPLGLCTLEYPLANETPATHNVYETGTPSKKQNCQKLIYTVYVPFTTTKSYKLLVDTCLNY